jgi:hypothetical protein
LMLVIKGTAKILNGDNHLMIRTRDLAEASKHT